MVGLPEDKNSLIYFLDTAFPHKVMISIIEMLILHQFSGWYVAYVGLFAQNYLGYLAEVKMTAYISDP